MRAAPAPLVSSAGMATPVDARSLSADPPAPAPAAGAKRRTRRACARSRSALAPGCRRRNARRRIPPLLRQRLWGLDFPNPVGLAAGYDKDARVPDALRRLGFGFVEVGTVTPRPQAGNAKPAPVPPRRGLAPSSTGWGSTAAGSTAVAGRLSAARHSDGIVGVNLGKNRDSRGRCRRLRGGRPASGGIGRLSGRQYLLAEHARTARPARPGGA